jgi:hypothetical protein
MKKSFLIGAVLTILSTVTPVMAEEIPDDKKSEYYYMSVPIERIYPYRKGYVVTYQKGVTGLGTVYLPIEWFTEAAGRGDIITMGSGTSWPYLTIYYKAGEFSHVRLYVRRERAHESWGNVPLNINIDDRFENVDDLRFEY